jgi:hypothetical protein
VAEDGGRGLPPAELMDSLSRFGQHTARAGIGGTLAGYSSHAMGRKAIFLQVAILYTFIGIPIYKVYEIMKL